MPDSLPGTSDSDRRSERLTLIARVGHLVAANLRLDELLEGAADAIHLVLGYENVAIPLIDPEDSGWLVLTAFGGSYKQTIGGYYRIPLSKGLMGAAAATRQTILVNDVTADPRYLATPGAAGRAELAVPILLGDQVLGVLNVESATQFTTEDADGLSIVADQLAVAIENARLHAAAQRVAVLEERHRLARELHDSVTQQLFSAILVAQTIGEAYARDPEEGDRRCAALLNLARAALTEMRALLAELRPPPVPASAPSPTTERGQYTLRTQIEPSDVDAELSLVRREGLLAALRAHASATELNGMRISVSCDEWQPQAEAFEEALFRIACEALHNAMKHSRASQTEVRLAARDGSVLLTVRDDGLGFDAQTEIARSRGNGEGIGMFSMRQRATDLGGQLFVESIPGQGTLVEARVPIHISATA